MLIPDQIDHFPPDLLKHFMEMHKFTDGPPREYNETETDLNLQFMQSFTKFDIFSLGVILLQVISGSPIQLQLKTRCKCTMITGKTYVEQPLWGFFDQQLNEPMVNKIMNAQNKTINNFK